MQDLTRGWGNYFWGEGACDALRSHAFARGVWEHVSPKNFWEWCNLVRFGAYFHKFFTFKKSVHSPLIILIKGCNLQCI